MEIIKLISAFGIGAIASKAIDALWIQPFLEKKRLNQWLREKRLEAYQELASNLLSFGLHTQKEQGGFANLGSIAHSVILTDDDEFLDKLYDFMAKRDLMFRIQDGSGESGDPEEIYYQLVKDSKALVVQLRAYIRNIKA